MATNDLDQSVSNAIASGVSGPVDLIAWLLRKGGLPVDKPVGGSDWMEEKGLTRKVKPGGAQVVGETVGSLMDPLSTGAAAAKGAMLLPALLRYADLDAVTRAEKLKKLGGNAQDIWEQTRLFKYPGQITDNPTAGANQVRWGMEAPSRSIDLSKLSDSPKTLDNFVDNPTLFDKFPQLLKTEVVEALHPKKANSAGVYAHYEGPAGRIYISPKANKEYARVLPHELNHAINAHANQLGSIGYVGEPLDPSHMLVPALVAQELRKAATTADVGLLAKHIEDVGITQAMTKRDPWAYSAGERLAEADAHRNRDSVSRHFAPTYDLNAGIYPRKDTKMLVPDDVAWHLGNALKLDADPKAALAYMLQKLK